MLTFSFNEVWIMIYEDPNPLQVTRLDSAKKILDISGNCVLNRIRALGFRMKALSKA